MPDLKELQEHFAFGKNWASYAETVGEGEIAEAVEGLRKLLQGANLDGKRFLDIGSGSGIHSLAAFRLGAGEVAAFDLDPDSVETTRAILAQYAPGRHYQVEQRSVFDLSPQAFGQFDVVYSWGVLHHTGNMLLALRKAAALVRPGGVFIFALYRKTWLCPFWKIEKKWYAKASQPAQSFAQRIYITGYRVALNLKRMLHPGIQPGRDNNRGMDFYHDVHDWLGGHPYESILPGEVDVFMRDLSFDLKGRYLRKPETGRISGILGSGCDEYCYLRTGV